jgi:hypothetical protein
MWAIYDRPTYFPDGIIARLWLIGEEPIPTDERITVLYDKAYSRESMLECIRLNIQQKMPGAFNLGRTPEDEPQVIEVWC